MRAVLALPKAELRPDPAAVARGQGIPPDVRAPERVEALIDQAVDLCVALSDPRGVYDEISVSDFSEVYCGEGLNAHRTPLEEIFPRSEQMALFAVTLGEEVSGRIRELFDENEPALGYVLDAVASEQADAAAELLARHYLRALLHAGPSAASTRVLAYSPGYCGWHITAQRKLFDHLGPEEIGITLNPSCLMQPLKSVSGVLVAGPASIHVFRDDYDFCDACATRQCRDRIASVTRA